MAISILHISCGALPPQKILLKTVPLCPRCGKIRQSPPFILSEVFKLSFLFFVQSMWSFPPPEAMFRGAFPTLLPPQASYRS